MTKMEKSALLLLPQLKQLSLDGAPQDNVHDDPTLKAADELAAFPVLHSLEKLEIQVSHIEHLEGLVNFPNPRELCLYLERPRSLVGIARAVDLECLGLFKAGSRRVFAVDRAAEEAGRGDLWGIEALSKLKTLQIEESFFEMLSNLDALKRCPTLQKIVVFPERIILPEKIQSAPALLRRVPAASGVRVFLHNKCSRDKTLEEEIEIGYFEQRPAVGTADTPRADAAHLSQEMVALTDPTARVLLASASVFVDTCATGNASDPALVRAQGAPQHLRGRG